MVHIYTKECISLRFFHSEIKLCNCHFYRLVTFPARFNLYVIIIISVFTKYKILTTLLIRDCYACTSKRFFQIYLNMSFYICPQSFNVLIMFNTMNRVIQGIQYSVCINTLRNFCHLLHQYRVFLFQHFVDGLTFRLRSKIISNRLSLIIYIFEQNPPLQPFIRFVLSQFYNIKQNCILIMISTQFILNLFRNRFSCVFICIICKIGIIRCKRFIYAFALQILS